MMTVMVATMTIKVMMAATVKEAMTMRAIMVVKTKAEVKVTVGKITIMIVIKLLTVNNRMIPII